MISISIFDEVPDGMGATSADQIDAFVHSDMSVKLSNGENVSGYAMRKRGNRKPILIGRLRMRIENVREKLLSVNAGLTFPSVSSEYMVLVVRRSLVKAEGRLLRCLGRVERARV